MHGRHSLSCRSPSNQPQHAESVGKCCQSDSPLHAVLDELIRGDALAELSAAAVDPLVQPTVRVDADGLGRAKRGGGRNQGQR